MACQDNLSRSGKENGERDRKRMRERDRERERETEIERERDRDRRNKQKALKKINYLLINPMQATFVLIFFFFN